MQKAMKRKSTEGGEEAPTKREKPTGGGDKSMGGSRKPVDRKFQKQNFPASKNKFGNRPAPGGRQPTDRDQKDNGPPVKKDWNKMKQDKKELKIKRKERRIKSKDLFELTAQAKKLYEKVKCKTEKNRLGLAKELHMLLKGNNIYPKLVLAHDTARVVQCLFKVAPQDIKAEVLKELLPSVPQMMSSKYSHFCIAALLKHGTSEMRDQVMTAILGHVVKLTSHALASSTLDSIYVTWASNKQRAFMRQEFYSDLYKRDKDENIKCIADVYKVAPHMKNIVLSNLKQHITHMANKKLVDNSLFHAVISDYLAECSAEDRSEMCGMFVSQLASLASTKEGAKAASHIFFYCAAKERRSALKSLKDHVQKICVHEFGYYLIIAILNTIDDTKMLKKYILDVIVTHLDEMILHEWGRKIIEWITAPGDASMFHPQFTAKLNEGLAENSKKDASIRQQEILEATETDIFQAIINQPQNWLNSGHIALTTATVLKRSAQKELLEQAFGALAKVVADQEWRIQEIAPPLPPAVEEQEDGAPPAKKFKKKKNPMIEDEKVETKEAAAPKELGIEDAGLHIALKKLIKEDKERLAKELPTFCDALVRELTKETVEKWIGVNRACFLLVTVLENATDATKAQLVSLCKQFKKELKSHKYSGAKVLLEKIN